jgi:heme/copper-type cytochrome/quinol oxidase subunit 2
MPIVIEAVPEATFNAWVASKGGTPKGAAAKLEPGAPAAPAAATETPATNEATPAGNAAAEQPAINQAATAQD